jgi:hypothetical protein
VRYRKLDANGDYSFGHGQADFYKDQPEAVGQAVKTRLWLFRGEWFLDLIEGMPWGGFPLNDFVVAQGQVLGAGTRLTRDVAVKMRVLETPGVVGISNYDSTIDSDARSFSVSMTIDTIYGKAFQINLGRLP